VTAAIDRENLAENRPENRPETDLRGLIAKSNEERGPPIRMLMARWNTMLETRSSGLQHVLKTYRSLKPLFTVLSSLALIPSTWRASIVMFIPASTPPRSAPRLASSPISRRERALEGGPRWRAKDCRDAHTVINRCYVT
jgi:hypothetical protein